MATMGTSESTDDAASVSRRRFLEAAGTTGVAMGVAGCAGGGGGGGPLEITMDGEWADAQDTVVQALYDAGLSEDVELEILPGDFETGARRSEFQSALDAGRASPDIFMMDSGWTIPFIVREQLVNLSEQLSSETLDYVQSDYLDAAVATASNPESGDLYGVPLFPDYPVMHYRKDLVEDAGYDPEGENWATEPMSWEEFAQVAADVWEEHDDLDYAFTTQGDNYEGTSCCTFNETMTSMGGAYFGDHGNLFGPVGDRPITVNEQPVHETIQMMRSFMYGPDREDTLDGIPKISNSDLVEFTEEDAREPFTAGDAAFLRNWPYVFSVNQSAAEEGNLDWDFSNHAAMPLPYGIETGQGDHEGVGGTNHALGGWHLTINPNSQRLEDAVAVLEAFANEDVMLTVFGELGNLPPDPSVTEQADQETVGELARFLDTLSVAGENTVPRPVTTAWPDESPLISEEVNAAYRGEKASEQAMADLEDRLGRIENENQ